MEDDLEIDDGPFHLELGASNGLDHNILLDHLCNDSGRDDDDSDVVASGYDGCEHLTLVQGINNGLLEVLVKMMVMCWCLVT